MLIVCDTPLLGVTRGISGAGAVFWSSWFLCLWLMTPLMWWPIGVRVLSVPKARSRS